MRIAFVVNLLEPTGGDRIIYHHVQGLKKLCKDKERYLEIQGNAIRNAERYEWKKVMPQIEETYKIIAQGKALAAKTDVPNEGPEKH